MTDVDCYTVEDSDGTMLCASPSLAVAMRTVVDLGLEVDPCVASPTVVSWSGGKQVVAVNFTSSRRYGVAATQWMQGFSFGYGSCPW